MSQTFLFRGQSRKFGEQVKIDSGEPVESKWSYGGLLYGRSGDFSVIYEEEPTFNKRVVYTDTVCQCVGAIGTNAAALFTGDIVTATRDGKSMYAVVLPDEANNHLCGFVLHFEDGSREPLSDYADLQIMGNIFDDERVVDAHFSDKEKIYETWKYRSELNRSELKKAPSRPYWVTFRVDARYIAKVEAESVEDAKRKAMDLYNDCDIGDFEDTDGKPIIVEDEDGNFVWEA